MYGNSTVGSLAHFSCKDGYFFDDDTIENNTLVARCTSAQGNDPEWTPTPKCKGKMFENMFVTHEMENQLFIWMQNEIYPRNSNRKFTWIISRIEESLSHLASRLN